ncbi:proline-rich nuclear receptor coactivator 2-like [Anthonomus grandis grandis]|uniref:proline-rich nuclear receptor coactivator 2-like n=1 Tax=Anthonomus grandis grandis TaxID=2921223 RepID=UPI002166B73A|nr:proline-rich nuclear receptor coactivator 2-like [Anthonomus grandis grandis]
MPLACDNHYSHPYNNLLQVFKDFIRLIRAVGLFASALTVLPDNMAMTKKTDTRSKIASQVANSRGAMLPKHNPQGLPPSPSSQGGSPLRLSPVRRSPSRSPSPRSSPGLIAGFYAGCKFTEPPSASALPLPPEHWMESKKSVISPFQVINYPSAANQCHHDFTQQLKLLLKVQA